MEASAAQTAETLSQEPSVRAPWRIERASRSDRRLVSRSSLTVLSRGMSKLTLLAFMIAAGRLLSLHEFASYSYLVALATIFTLVGETGVPLVGSREIAAARQSPRNVYWSSLPIVAVVGGLSAGVLLLIGSLGSAPGTHTSTLLLAAAFVLGNRLFDFGATLLRGLGRYGFEAGIQIGGSVFFVATAVAAAAGGLGVTGVFGVLCLKEWLSGVVAYAALLGDVGRPLRPSGALWRKLVRSGIYLALATGALMLITRASFFVLSNTAPARNVAWYSASLRFADAAFLFATTAGFALLPGVAYLAQHEPARLRRLFGRVIVGVGVVSVVAALVMVPFAGDIVRLVFGPNFKHAAGSAQVLLAGLPVYAAFGVAWYALLALNFEKQLLKLAVGGAVVSCVASLVFVPDGSDAAAAATYLAALSFMAVTTSWLLYRRLGHG